MTFTEYVRDLDADVRYRVAFTVDRGRIVEFVVQLEVAAEKQWKPVVRYDTAHGFAHCDRYSPDGNVKRHELLPVADFNQALTFATQSIRRDWQDFVQPFREEVQ